MDKKRSKGVTILAILIFMGGAGNLSTDIFVEFNGAPAWRIIICSMLHIAQMICAIGILNLKEVARKIAIIVYAAYMFWVPLLLVLFTSKNLVNNVKNHAAGLDLKTAGIIAEVVLIFAIISSVLWFAFIIYFFTRPKVKEQFQKK